jgi:hypothetical protein
MGGACIIHEIDKNSYKILGGNLRRRDHFRDLGEHGRIILKGIPQKQDLPFDQSK